MYYTPATHTLSLLNDAGTVWMTAPVGGAGELANGQCRIPLAQAGASAGGTVWTVTLPVAFTVGPKEIHQYVISHTGAASGWQPRGTWTVRARIDGVSPASAPAGQVVMVTGTGFGASPGSLTVNGTAAPPLQWTPTSIMTVVPVAATSGPVVVWTGGQASNEVAFTVVPGPVIHELSVTWGPVGTVVALIGANFGSTKGSSTVKFNGKTATTSTWTNTAIIATVPSGATSGLVVVTRSGMPPSPGVPFTVGAEEVVYYTTDGIGSVRMVTTFGQHVVSRHDYLPFGEAWQPGPSHPQPLGFAGKELDPETGTSSSQALNYFGARYLHSATGRFTAVDPVVDKALSLLDPQRWNAYPYSKNNPLRHTDPDGRIVTFANPELEERFRRLAAESVTFANSWEEAHAREDIVILVTERGLRVNEQRSGGDIETFLINAEGVIYSRMWLDPVRTRDQLIAHEQGHVQDMMDDKERYLEDARRSTRESGTFRQRPHFDRREEQIAEAFAKRVMAEQREYRRAQQDRERRERDRGR